MEFENLSASYDVGIAKKYGLNCAVLLNKLIYLSKYTSRDDGFCWKSSKELEDELGLTRHQQDLAIKKLEEEGIIETKNTYIKGTQIKCKHFKIIKSDKSDLPESGKSGMPESDKSVYNNNTVEKIHNIKEIYKEKFETFYSAYPKKVKKSDVEKWFYKNKPNDELFKTIMNKLEDYKTIWKNKDMQYIPYPTTWLNGKQWEDEIQRKQTYEDILAELDEMERRGEL